MNLLFLKQTCPSHQKNYFFLLQKKRNDSRINGDDHLTDLYRATTTPYPHQRPRSPDPTIGYFPNSSSMPSGALAYMLSGSNSGISDSLRTPGACEIHMNSSYLPPGVGLPHTPGAHLPSGGVHFGPTTVAPRLPRGCNWLRPLIQCCRMTSPLAKFPSRAKRIDVISRFVFPLVFAVFNLAYWLYYLFAKSKSPQDLS